MLVFPVGDKLEGRQCNHYFTINNGSVYTFVALDLIHLNMNT